MFIVYVTCNVLYHVFSTRAMFVTSSGVGVDILLAVDQASILGEKWFTIARTLCRLESNSLQDSLCVFPDEVFIMDKIACDSHSLQFQISKYEDYSRLEILQTFYHKKV